MHTPYDGSSKPFTIGLKPLDPAMWLDIDKHFDTYIAEKKRLYSEETANVLVAEAGSEDAQQEVLELIQEHLDSLPSTHRHPSEGWDPAFPHARSSKVKLDPRLRGEDGAEETIATAGLLVQEDLVIMQKQDDAWRLTAASLCFPSAWNLREKFGKPMHSIHKPVPGFGEGTRNAGLIERMFDNLRVEQPVIRWNWSLYGDTRLYHPASDNQMKRRFGDGPINGKVFMRLERQTLRKLPRTGAIVFTIRIFIDPLEILQTHADGPQLAISIAEQLEAMTPAEISYKGLEDERERVLMRLKALAKT